MNRKFGALAAGFLLLASIVLAGCSSAQTQTSQCGWIITNGFQQSHGVKRVIYPNESVAKGNNDQVWYVPCNARNYIISQNGDSAGDRHNPTVAKTGNAKDGTPGVQVNVYWSMHWTLNENNNTMVDFWAYCQKYTCQSAQQNDNSANNSTPGWNSMLAEGMSKAIDRAGIDTAKDFGPDLWNDPSQWPAFATKASSYILAELRQSVLPYTDDFFCLDGVATREGKPCTPPSFTVEAIEPVNGNLRNINNQQSEMDAQSAQNAQRLHQAQQLYGPYAQWALAQEDIIQKCKDAGASCNVVIGNGATSVTVPTK